MKIQKEWASFRLTLLLYSIVFIIPLTFYFAYISYHTTAADKKMLQQIGLKEGISNSLVTALPTKTDQQKQILQTLENILDNYSKLYTMFYWSLFIAMILTLLIIYLIKDYTRSQTRKDSLYDQETKLFNRQYFLLELRGICARAIRHKLPLSITSISIENFEGKNRNKTYDQKTKKHIFKVFGALITSVTRISDVPCRYNDGVFIVILPITEKDNAFIFEKHIHQAIQEHNFHVSPNLKFNFATTQFDYTETPEEFVLRTENLLQ